MIKEMYEQLGISPEVYEFGRKVEEELKERFLQIDQTAEYNQLKVLHAMQKNRVSEECFHSSSGYGYNDYGRECPGTGLCRYLPYGIGSGPSPDRLRHPCPGHCPFGNLRPGDELLSPVGKPYDTLEEVIGIRPSAGSLAEYGITYRQTELLPDGTFDYPAIARALNEKTKLVTIQRSKGYLTRPSFSVKQIGELIAFIKEQLMSSVRYENLWMWWNPVMWEQT